MLMPLLVNSYQGHRKYNKQQGAISAYFGRGGIEKERGRSPTLLTS